jgi:alkylation response protein AidB-like acyl-CoA dehydrogenase
VRTRAEPQPDGTYKVFGTKIFITYGEHDMAENIVHLVLARVVGAPEGVKGISLFVVPKFMVNPMAPLGARNDVHCVSIEHKMGIKASPTAVLQFGDHGGAVGYMVGQENRGLEYMFIMMNAARYGVGVQGIAVAGRAYQKAVNYAKDRVQSRPVDGSMNTSAPIIHHPDVRRMLMTMRAFTEGCRAMASVAAAAFDAAHHHPDAEVRKQNATFYEFMVPLIKGYSTEMSLEVTSLGVQVHGGMGFIEETGAGAVLPRRQDPDHLRRHDGDPGQRSGGPQDGARWRADRQGDRGTDRGDRGGTDAQRQRDAEAVAKRLRAARRAFLDVVDFVAGNSKASPNAVYAGSVTYLLLAGNLVAGWQTGACPADCPGADRRGQGRGFHEGQDCHGPFLRRPHPQSRARPARQRGGRGRQRDRPGPGSVLRPSEEIFQ